MAVPQAIDGSIRSVSRKRFLSMSLPDMEESHIQSIVLFRR
jgi:hypothetical protein